MEKGCWMPVHFPVFLQQVQRYCEKSLISRKVLALRCHGQQCSNAVPHLQLEMEDAAAGWELVFSILFCKQTGSYKKYYMGRLTLAYLEKKYNVAYRGIPVGANYVLLALKFASQVGCIAVKEQTSETCFSFHSVGVGK